MVRRPLDGAFAKLRRGREHLDTLRAELPGLIKELGEPPISVRQHLDTNTSEWVVSVAKIAEFPRISLLVGDVAHNLRSALDYLVSEMAYVDGGGTDPPHRKTQFPIKTHPSDFASRTTLMLENISSANKVRIEKLQPYNPWKGLTYHPLGLLGDIDNDDKHRLVVATAASLADAPLRFPHYGHNCEFDGRLSGRALARYPLQVGAELLRVGVRVTGPKPSLKVDFGVRVTGPKPSLKVDSDFPQYVAFVNGLDVVITLREIADGVESVLDQWRSFFNRKEVRGDLET